MENTTNRIEQELANWKSEVEWLRSLDLDNLEESRAYKQSKLKFIESLPIKYGKDASEREKLAMKILLESRDKLEKELYPKTRPLTRLIIRAFRNIVQSIKHARQNVKLVAQPDFMDRVANNPKWSNLKNISEGIGRQARNEMPISGIESSMVKPEPLSEQMKAGVLLTLRNLQIKEPTDPGQREAFLQKLFNGERLEIRHENRENNAPRYLRIDLWEKKLLAFNNLVKDEALRMYDLSTNAVAELSSQTTNSEQVSQKLNWTVHKPGNADGEHTCKAVVSPEALKSLEELKVREAFDPEMRSNLITTLNKGEKATVEIQVGGSTQNYSAVFNSQLDKILLFNNKDEEVTAQDILSARVIPFSPEVKEKEAEDKLKDEQTNKKAHKIYR